MKETAAENQNLETSVGRTKITGFAHASPIRGAFMSTRTITHALLGLASATIMSVQAFATTIVFKNFDDLVKESDAIFAGRVASIESQENANQEIYTFVTFDQLSLLGGTYQGATLTLRFKGGRVGNRISQIVGSPEFNVNEQVVLFVEGNGQYMVPVVGWTQGVFRAVQDPVTGRTVIHDHEGNRVVGVQAGRVLRDRTAQPAAHIVGEPNNIVSTASSNQGDGGKTDDNSVSARADKETAALAAMPTMTGEAFLSSIRNSASARTFPRELKSVRPGDFSVPVNNHTDAFLGEKAPAPVVAPSQSPAIPQRKPLPQAPRQ